MGANLTSNHDRYPFTTVGNAGGAPAESGLLPDDDAVLARAGHLLAIGRLLKRLYADEAAADWWVTSPCDGLGGFAPITLMLEGVEVIKRVRAFREKVEARGANG